MRATTIGCIGAWMVGLLSTVTPAAAGELGLADAVKTRNSQAVAALLKQGADVNLAQPDGATALHWAAHWDDVGTAKLLIGAGARVEAVNDYGLTPLLLACTDAGGPMIELLLKAGANPNAALPTGETPLMAAARTGKLAGVNALVAAGAQVNAKEKLKGQTALMWAVAEHHLDVATTLLDHGADVKARASTGSTALLFASREGDLELARLLLAHDADLKDANSAGVGVLLMATVRGHVELARFLLDRGADPNAEEAGFTPLHWAAGKWETEFTTDYSYAPGATSEWAALVGLRRGKTELIAALLAHGANVNARLTKSPPQSSRTGFRFDLIQGATPFYLAALVGDVEVMRLLLAHGADAAATAKDGTTPLIVAAGLAHHDNRSTVREPSYLDAVKYLVSLGADVHAANREGWTALHAAAYVGHEQVVQYLVDHGAELNAKTKYGQTPLGIAEGYCRLREAEGRILPMPGCIIAFRPQMAELLRKMGAVSEGKVSIDGSGELKVATSVVPRPAAKQ